MAYDQKLAIRIDGFINTQEIPYLKKTNMFGGVGYMINGNMAFGLIEDKLIVRVGKEAYQAALDQPLTSQFDLTGRPMRGWVYVEPSGINKDEGLLGWINQGINFAMSLPPK
jgi:hypothetical protein